MKLATTARRGFQAAPTPPAPSAPPLESEVQEEEVTGGDGSSPSASSSKSFLKWKSSKKSKRKSQAPPAPKQPNEALTHLGYKKGSPAGPTALPPLSSSERRKRLAPDPRRLHPAQVPVPPPARGRSTSAPEGQASRKRCRSSFRSPTTWLPTWPRYSSNGGRSRTPVIP